MNCQDCRILINNCIEGPIGQPETEALHKHIAECPKCRKVYEDLTRVTSFVNDACRPSRASAAAREAILSRLPEAPAVRSHAGRIAAIAGGVAACGILLALVLGRVIPGGREDGISLPVSIANLKGTVLVRRSDSDRWQPMALHSDVYLGDSFRSADGSELALLLDDGSRVTLYGNSELSLQSYEEGVEFGLPRGGARAKLSDGHPPFAVVTPHGRIEALGTDFTVWVRQTERTPQ